MGTGVAPGKVILFGEHFVVYGAPALAVPLVSHRITVRVDRKPGAWSLPDDLLGHVERLLRLLDVNPAAVQLRVRSSLPMGVGLGSSAAFSVALVRALGYDDQETVRSLAHRLECETHGRASGVDDTVATYETPIAFSAHDGMQAVRPGAPLRLFVGVVPRNGSTREAVARVRSLAEQRPQWFAERLERCRNVVYAGRVALESGDIRQLGTLFNENHALLRDIGVSDDRLERLCDAARAAGAYGAKLSGAGQGGAMIALAPEGLDLGDALRAAGAQVVLTAVGDAGDEQRSEPMLRQALMA